MSKLAKKRCIPCEGGVEALSPKEAEKLRTEELNDEWMLIDDAHLLVREFRFKNFADAMTFANKIAKIADEENHHPELNVGWGHVGVELTTHAIHGLSENDFILAAKIDELEK
ncbi:4a-hydroxytetrahydrobiopterin dehydratase [Candidatus Parcubacteria bacterium]|nr:4a-hydroxytetrahydrobiopterin dehydratase [Candidatus Parcubacteria bacterium]